VPAFSTHLTLKSAAQEHPTTCISAESTTYSTHYNFILDSPSLMRTNKAMLSNPNHFNPTHFDPTYFNLTYPNLIYLNLTYFNLTYFNLTHNAMEGRITSKSTEGYTDSQVIA
jgi:hypothetical protein